MDELAAQQPDVPLWIGKAPAEREGNPNRKIALEISMRAYISKRNGNVMNPAVGMEFDSLDEAYQFYNLYSWEVGFGIRFANGRLNVNRRKCMQEIVCGCAFDRESEESFQEKRTSLSGVYLKVNLPIERHASKIYTRAMFEKFGESLYKAGAYEIDVVKPMKLYHLTRVDALAHDKWSKVQFKVEVFDDKSTFACECGHFEHSGMVCCHSLKLAMIPVKYIMKRWTKDARDILPEHLARYQKDKGPRGYKTYRHNAMYIKALECVRLGDSNVKCYDVFMAMMKEVYTTLLPLSQGKYGMGVEEREAAQGRPGADGTYASIADGRNFT
ncbi:hypothetical protein ZWY2020_019404 [Hordeum vulgare]|nr:hypothetical protein ZWY2020_019404 [Hordeum vulgare]